MTTVADFALEIVTFVMEARKNYRSVEALTDVEFPLKDSLLYKVLRAEYESYGALMVKLGEELRRLSEEFVLNPTDPPSGNFKLTIRIKDNKQPRKEYKASSTAQVASFAAT